MTARPSPAANRGATPCTAGTPSTSKKSPVTLATSITRVGPAPRTTRSRVLWPATRIVLRRRFHSSNRSNHTPDSEPFSAYTRATVTRRPASGYGSGRQSTP